MWTLWGERVLQLDKVKKAVYITITVLILSILIFSYYYSVKDSGKIYSGVKVDSINVSGLTCEEAEKLVTEKTNEKKSKKIEFKLGDLTYSRTLGELGFDKEIKDAIKEAFYVGRSENKIANFFRIISLPIANKNIESKTIISDEKVQESINYLVDKVYIKSENAKVENIDGKFVKSKEVVGRYLDASSLKEEIKNSIGKVDTVEIKALPILPEVKSEYFDGIDAVLGSFITDFHRSEDNRKFNIELGASKISNKFVEPQQEISFNDTIGEMNEAGGFKAAGVIVNGEFDRGWGGGICQVSTTLYNALVRSDIEILERSNHSRPIGYVERGADAAVAPGYKDLKFKNNLKHKIYIDSKIVDDKIEFIIYGNSSDKEFDIDLITKFVSEKTPETITKYSDQIPEGEVQVESQGNKGYDYSSFKEYKKNGEVVKVEKYLSSHYIPKNRVVVIGQGKAKSKDSEEKSKKKESKKDNKKGSKKENKKETKSKKSKKEKR